MASDGQIAVQLEALDGVVSELGEFTSDVTAQLADLEQRVSQLHVQWSGSGADAHRKAHDEWAEGARLMADGAQRLQRAAAAAHAAYTDAARRNRSLFS